MCFAGLVCPVPFGGIRVPHLQALATSTLLRQQAVHILSTQARDPHNVLVSTYPSMISFCSSGLVCPVPSPEIGSVRVSRLHALATYRGTSRMRKRVLIRLYSRTMPRALRWSYGVPTVVLRLVLFPMSEEPLYPQRFTNFYDPSSWPKTHAILL